MAGIMEETQPIAELILFGMKARLFCFCRREYNCKKPDISVFLNNEYCVFMNLYCRINDESQWFAIVSPNELYISFYTFAILIVQDFNPAMLRSAVGTFND